MLKLQRRKFAFVMPSGIDAEVQSLCGANQADLTQSELPFEERLNRVLADVIVSVEGYDNWHDMKVSQRIEAVKKMLDADRKSLLVAARYCSMRTDVFELKYEWTESSGVKQEKRIELGMLGESNIAESIDTIAERWGIERDLVMRVNYIGGMATKPYKKQFEKYPIERGELDYDVEVSGVTFRLQLLTAQAQPKGLQEKDIDAHTSLQKVIAQGNAQKAERESVNREIAEFVSQAQKDPLAQKIDQNFNVYLFKMAQESPEQANKAAQIMQSTGRLQKGQATKADTKLLREHWEYVRKALSTPPAPTAPPAPPKPEPPKTETPGQAQAQHSTFDPHKLRGMNTTQQIAALKKAGFFG